MRQIIAHAVESLRDRIDNFYTAKNHYGLYGHIIRIFQILHVLMSTDPIRTPAWVREFYGWTVGPTSVNLGSSMAEQIGPTRVNLGSSEGIPTLC